MKLQKYVFLMPDAVTTICKRFDIDHLSAGYIFVLYSIQYLPHSCTQQSVIRHAKRMGYTIAQPTISLALTYYISIGFVDVLNGWHTLAPRGREFLSAIRRYLLNKRL